MAPPTPDTIERSARLYRGLLRLYPERHRREYGVWMAQTFRDLCRQAYGQEAGRGVFKVWLSVLPDLGSSLVVEHIDNFRRWKMNLRGEPTGANPRLTAGLLIAAVLIAGGILANVAIRESGGPVALGAAVAIVLNLAGALVMEIFGRLRGAVIGATVLLIGLTLLPLLWVPDGAAWLRENPANTGIIVILAGYALRQYGKAWPVFAIALILGAAHILTSFL